MKKSLLINLLFILIISKSYAQYSVGTNLVIMRFIGDNYSYYTSKYEGGISVFGKYNLNNNIRLGINMGHFYNNDGIKKVVMNPLTGSFEYSFLTTKIRPYSGVTIGAYRLAYSFVDAFSKNPNPHSSFYFGFAPIIGVENEFKNHFFTNTNCKLNYILTRENGYGENSKCIELSFGIGYKFK